MHLPILRTLSDLRSWQNRKFNDMSRRGEASGGEKAARQRTHSMTLRALGESQAAYAEDVDLLADV
jgi:hypothetical protein